MGLGTLPLPLLFPGLGKHSPAAGQTAGRVRVLNPQTYTPTPIPPVIWSLVPEAQGKFSLIPELPLALQKVAVKLDRGEDKRPS